MATSSVTSSSTLRMAGMATGLDIDGWVQKLMDAENTKLDKAKQDKQILEWKQDDYRSITTTLKGFYDKYFDVLSSSYMKSSSNYKAFSSTITPENAVLDTGAVAVSANADAATGTHSIIIKQLATAQIRQSASGITKNVSGDGAYTLNAGETFNLTVDGVTKTITLADMDTDGTVTVGDLNAAITNAFGTFGSSGTGKIVVDDTTNPGKLTFKAADGSGVSKISVSAGTTNNALTNMGFGSGAILSNRISTFDTLDAISSKLKGSLSFTTLSDGTTQGIKLTINTKTFEFSKDTTVYSMMSQVNADPTANVTMQYDDINDEFRFIAKQTGAGENIAISEDTSTFLAAASITDNQAGQDAIANIDGTDITRSSNTFTVSGITYTALKVTTDGTTDRKVNISLNQDVDTVYNNIKAFVDDYNK